MSVSFERLFGSKGAGISLVDVVVANPDGSCDSGLAAIDGLELGVARVAHSLRDALFEESGRRIGDVVELVEESAAHLAMSARDFDGVREEADAVVELPEAFDLGNFPVFGTRCHGTAFIHRLLSALIIQPCDSKVDQNVFAVCQSARGAVRDFDVRMADAGVGWGLCGIGIGGAGGRCREQPLSEVGVVGLGRVQLELDLVDLGGALDVFHKRSLGKRVSDGGTSLRGCCASEVVVPGLVGWLVAELAHVPNGVECEADPHQ